MSTFQYGVVTRIGQGNIIFVGDLNPAIRTEVRLIPANYKPVHVALRGEIEFKLNGKRSKRKPLIPAVNTLVAFSKSGNTFYWCPAEEYDRLAATEMWRIVKKGRILWQGRDLCAIEIAEVYNPRNCQNRGKGAQWQLSRDNGKTFTNCDCPAEFDEQFDSLGNRTIPSKRKQAA